MMTVLRREEKYLLSLLEALQCAARFEKILRPDEFSRNGAYRIRSLYFDTVDDQDFHDKLTEQNCRRKLRLRIYSPEDSHVKLELKQKENVYQRKRSLLITRADALSTLDPADFFNRIMAYQQALTEKNAPAESAPVESGGVG